MPFNVDTALLLRGNHASRPAANTLIKGALYYCTDHKKIYQGTGPSNTWGDFTDAFLTAIAAGAVGTTELAARAATFAKLQAIATGKLLGRSTAGSGDIEELAVGSGLSLSAGTLSASGGGGGGKLDLLESHAASASSTIDFTAFAASGYSRYILEYDELVISATAFLDLRFSTSPGSWDSSTIYGHSNFSWHAGGSGLSGTATGASLIRTSWPGGGQVAAAGKLLSGVYDFQHLGSATAHKYISGYHRAWDGTTRAENRCTGMYESTTPVIGVRIFPSAGNFTSGNFRMYGVKNT